MKIEEVKTTCIGGINTACIGRKELANLIGEYCLSQHGQEKKTIIIFDNNGHGISMANRDKDFCINMEKADLIHADGQSIVAFSKWIKGSLIPERTATTDMIHDIPDYWNKPLRHFLLGGEEGVAEKAADLLSDKYQNMIIAGWQHGYFSADEEAIICNNINKLNIDILWVGLGKPKEQEFCIRNKHRLNASVIITCGGCYNYITGDYPRAPEWVQNLGFEWLHRMITNPRKLFIRYATTNPYAIYCVLKHEMVNRFEK